MSLELDIRLVAIADINMRLFDNFVGANKERARNGQAESVGRFNVEHQFELGRLQDRHFCRFRTFQNLSNVLSRLAVHPADAWAVARERANFRKLPNKTHDGKLVPAGRTRQSARVDPIGSGRLQ